MHHTVGPIGTHVNTYTHTLVVSLIFLFKKYYFIHPSNELLFFNIFDTLCIWLCLKMIMVVWSAPASSEEVCWTLNAKWTVASLLSQSLSNHG